MYVYMYVLYTSAQLYMEMMYVAIYVDMYIIIYTHIHPSTCHFWVYMHTVPWVDRPKLKESFTAMDVVLNLSSDAEVVGVRQKQQKALRELVVFFRTKKIYNFSVARLSFEITVSWFTKFGLKPIVGICFVGV